MMMVESATSGNGNLGGAPSSGVAQPVHVRIIGQYIKDLSFENPNVRKLLATPADNPSLQIGVNVNALKVSDNTFESTIEFKAEATGKAGIIYDLELSYSGLFHIENIPEQALEPFLLINCPAIVFPFLRRLVADLTREGGFPPLLLDPLDFGALFMKRQEERAKAGGQTPSN
jgi:preprotein translocase subunit SecB